MRNMIAACVSLAAVFAAPARAAIDSVTLLPVTFEQANPMWSAARDQITATRDCVAARKSACTPADIVQLLDALTGETTALQLAAVNHWINRHPYVSDIRNWKVSDHWETIDQFLVRGGDCEDYAIAKYGLLRALGVAPESMRVLIVEDLRKQQVHAVLAVDTESGTQYLDNQLLEVTPAASIQHYVVRVALNESGLWRMPDMPLVSASASQR